jgi:hypothetical protein
MNEEGYSYCTKEYFSKQLAVIFQGKRWEGMLVEGALARKIETILHVEVDSRLN